MSAKRRVHVRDVREGALVLEDSAAHYLATVLRLKKGDRVAVFSDGREADATIDDATPTRVTLTVERVREVSKSRRVVLVFALAKGDKCDAVVRDATELDATEIIFWSAARAVVKLDEARATEKRTRWTRIAEEAARQSGRADAPPISGPISLDLALKYLQYTSIFVLHPAATERLHDALAPTLESNQEIAFIIGPEGGFAPEEIALAQKSGAHVVSFGRTTLRTETVPAAVLGALAVRG